LYENINKDLSDFLNILTLYNAKVCTWFYDKKSTVEYEKLKLQITKQ